MSLTNVNTTQTSIDFEIDEIDADDTGKIEKIELVHSNGTIVADNINTREFTGLLFNNKYTIRVTYFYDLNDGNGKQTISLKSTLYTKIKTTPIIYELIEDEYVIVGIDNNIDYNDVKIEESIEGIPVTTIKENAFSGWKLKNVVIPKTISVIERHAFPFGMSLVIYCEVDRIPCGWDGGWNADDVHGPGLPVIMGYTGITGETDSGLVWLESKDETISIIDYHGTSSYITIPDTINDKKVISITPYAFFGLKIVKKIDITEGIKSIGALAFHGCSNLENISLPQSLQSIGESAFYGSGLTSIVIPSKVLNLTWYTFASCSKLTTVEFDKTLLSIDYDVFYSCPNLKNVYYKGTEEDFSKIYIYNEQFNNGLDYATRYYYSESEPTLNADGTAYDGNYWRYDLDGKKNIIWVYENS